MRVTLRGCACACAATAVAALGAPAGGYAEMPAAPSPIAGAMTLSLVRVGGSPPFALAGGRVTVRGTVFPYVGGQKVKLSVYFQGRKVAVKVLAEVPDGTGRGLFHYSFSSRVAGVLQIRGAHYTTAEQAQFTARSPYVHFVNPNLGPGASGLSVRLLQSELDVLHYAVPLSGVFDEGTGRALIAFRKIVGMERIEYAGTEVFRRLLRGEGAFHVRYARDGRHVEADLTKQVLAEIEPGGRVRTIYEMSSGKPSTPTVIGHFQVYSKTFGTNAKGMVDSNYFIRGYAIHGYAEVPTYAASHGCLRVPIPDAAAIYGWVQLGTGVDVYDESGGGSTHVRGNAGP